MERQLIGRGILAGALGGVFAFFWSKVLIEPVIGRAIDFENGVGAAHEAAEHGPAGHSHGGDEGVELFSRGVQSNIGMGLGVLIFSVAMGALLAVVFCVVYGRTSLSARALAALTAGGMLVSLWIVPALKYPPNPPAVSLDETIQQRTLLYLLLVVLSAGLFVGSVLLARRLTPKLGIWNATLIGVADYVVSMAVVFLILPGIHETPSTFPAGDLYDFRLYSLGTQVVIWATIGLVFGALASKVLDEKKRESVSA
ncbi:CbtA family protein [Mycolicibacterium alvei]|jgi:predicted cobalt transporter CbtA|uniref:Cobalt transporter n=1 Tax=Mycolicibacterium alvei TaxID=67081 RepID=A0A6N4UVE8_9MYCO|nr:CbtA family protein [Mycolicibacterium alvei]MCV7002425.1 CbtA family protein [Mycolicibacterium alvei]BBX29046.1 cobalt transporter [Mycolicibacterium alvei]